MRHFLSLLDLQHEELLRLIEDALELKDEHARGDDRFKMSGRVLGLFFEKPSMRTRVSFEAAIAHLGGSCIFLSKLDVGLGAREPISDFARVISRYVDVLAARTFSHETITELAKYSSCPVINALSDHQHPCQALADFCAIREHFGRTAGIKLVFVGDGNNVARSLAMGSALLDMNFVLACPEGYALEPELIASLTRMGGTGSITIEHDPLKAARDADVIYTDVWASMGQESERAQRQTVFAPYQVNARLMKAAKPSARFLHCLPAHRGEEVSADVIDGPQSLVVEQAAYRLHAQKALLLWLLNKARSTRSSEDAPAQT